MKTGISIGSYIYAWLSQNEELKKLVSDKIYPIVAEETANYPYIVFTKNISNTKNTKTCVVYDEVSVSITVVAKNYTDTCNIMEIIRGIFENKENDFIIESVISSETEDFMEGAFLQTITFDMQVNLI